MRIISGSLRGRTFAAPAGTGTRPTGDRIRESLFNILHGRLNGLAVLDAFAGSGALSFEALSRGARSAVLFDTDAAALRTLRANIESLGLSAQCVVRAQDFLSGAPALQGQRFGLIFLDPPYAAGLYQQALELVDALQLLADCGIVMAEHSVRDALPQQVGSLAAYDKRRYGITVLTFYKRQEDSLE